MPKYFVDFIISLSETQEHEGKFGSLESMARDTAHGPGAGHSNPENPQQLSFSISGLGAGSCGVNISQDHS
jgi:hypothetical protein